jgi:HEAT repeat protein
MFIFSMPFVLNCAPSSEPLVIKTYKGVDLFSPSKGDVDILIEGLKDKNPRLRMSVANALKKLGPEAEKAIPALVATLNDRDIGVSGFAGQALRAIGGKAVPSLIEALQSDNYEVRWSAVEILGDIGAEANSAVPALRKIKESDDYIAGDGSYPIRSAASKAIEKIERAN